MSRPVAARPSTLLISCGALGREITTLIDVLGLDNTTVQCLPAHYHNTPDRIPEAVEKKILAGKGAFDRILVLYGECGTGGRLDEILRREGIERIPGNHCYEFFMGSDDFHALFDAEPGSFFLTDYLVRHFDRLIIEGLGLDRFPQLIDDYFRHYTQLVYLAQIEDPELDVAAREAAERLGLAYDYRFTGYGGLKQILGTLGSEETDHGATDHRLLA